jgi:hypothetical protein
MPHFVDTSTDTKVEPHGSSDLYTIRFDNRVGSSLTNATIFRRGTNEVVAIFRIRLL